MALTDVNFQTGEIQDYIVEIPSAGYAGEIDDINIEPSSTQYLVTEIPRGGGNIFIMSE